MILILQKPVYYLWSYSRMSDSAHISLMLKAVVSVNSVNPISCIRLPSTRLQSSLNCYRVAVIFSLRRDVQAFSTFVNGTSANVTGSSVSLISSDQAFDMLKTQVSHLRKLSMMKCQPTPPAGCSNNIIVFFPPLVILHFHLNNLSPNNKHHHHDIS
ncbi:hypothetical protein Hypma_010531 [Hypsizygus marmoreus]|uniref:Uncharacterized protein n=1 Tax=Hypsizygus marmoreus TaxID=39966 RepID=A0A369JM97_HYPMA|nr:hypothetical protein Hypma_010531 [Hypsizygus marmoreus]